MQVRVAARPLSFSRIKFRVALILLFLGLVATWHGTAGRVSSAGARLMHGPVVGAVTASAATVFVRTDQSAAVLVRYGQMPDLSDAVESPVQFTDAATDFTTKIQLRDLGASTPFYLDVNVDGVSQLTLPYPRFKTFPKAGEKSPFKFVVLTDFTQNPSATFANADAENPDLVIIGGDFDHSNPTTLDDKRQMFKNLYNPADGMADFVNLILRKYPVAHFWDDHDYGANNSDKRYRFKARSRQVLQEYFPVYELGPYGDYQKFSYGQADFFLLDSRSQRDPDTAPDGPRKSMLDGDDLGEVGQLHWLLDGLLHSTATWKFVLTPVVFNPTLIKSPRFPDSWRGFQYERDRIVRFVQGHAIRGVVMISGDAHAGGIDNGAHSDFPEMLVPAANITRCLSAYSPGVWSEGFYGASRRHRSPCNGYGVVNVATNPDRINMTVKNDLGETKLSLDVFQ